MGNVRWHWITQAFGLAVFLEGAGVGLGTSRYYNSMSSAVSYSQQELFDSVVLSSYQRSSACSPNNSTAHARSLEWVVVILVILQASLGSLHHRIFKAQQRPTIRGMIHQFFGTVAICLGDSSGVTYVSLEQDAALQMIRHQH